MLKSLLDAVAVLPLSSAVHADAFTATLAEGNAVITEVSSALTVNPLVLLNLTADVDYTEKIELTYWKQSVIEREHRNVRAANECGFALTIAPKLASMRPACYRQSRNLLTEAIAHEKGQARSR